MASINEIHSLVDAFKSGSERAFNELFLAFQRPIYYLAFRMVQNHNDADEIVQKTFMQVYKNIKYFRGESSFKTWLYRIAINQCKDHLKSREHRTIKISMETPVMKKLKNADESPVQKILKNEQTKMLIRTIERLSQQQKTAVMLRIFEDMAFKDIANVLECKESTAKVHFHQAIIKMKALVEESGHDMQTI